MGLLSFARPRRRDGCFLYVSDRGLANIVLTRRGFGAITFGHVIVANMEPTPTVWRHELRHVAQYERLGLSFLPLYLWYRARYGYFEHPLERDAAEDPTLFRSGDVRHRDPRRGPRRIRRGPPRGGEGREGRAR